MHNHFSLQNNELYKKWRDWKLSAYPVDTGTLMTTINSSEAPSKMHIEPLLRTATLFNMAFYRLTGEQATSKNAVHQLATACGLRNINHNLCADADSLTSLQVTRHPGQHEYIPYTNRPLSWHTDGYYNRPEEQIHGMLLHCARPAAEGGTNVLMDPEIVYILLRETDPAYIETLMHPNAFTIPANISKGEIIRPEQSGPVFSVTANGNLHMRYSARQRNVKWRTDQITQKAEHFLLDLWEQESVYKIRHTLRAGEGVICNNVLHCRTEFKDPDNKGRLLYRGRYIDRMTPAHTPDSPIGQHE
ncbi:MAG: TauD/TfdA family dioxygenase [Thiolinea sp.]